MFQSLLYKSCMNSYFLNSRLLWLYKTIRKQMIWSSCSLPIWAHICAVKRVWCSRGQSDWSHHIRVVSARGNFLCSPRAILTCAFPWSLQTPSLFICRDDNNNNDNNNESYLSETRFWQKKHLTQFLPAQLITSGYEDA